MRARAVTDRVAGFFYHPQSDEWLRLLRVGLATVLTFYCASLARDWNYLLAETGGGLISRGASEAVLSAQSSLIPRISWLVAIGNVLRLDESTVLSLTWVCLLGASALLLLGLFSRASAIVAWFIHLAAIKSGGLFSYGVDNFTTIGLFYLVLAPFPDRWSIDHQLRKRSLKDRHLHGLFRRVLQLHLCLIYFFGGLAKCFGVGWWNGESLWRALTHPPFNVISPEILVRFSVLFPVATISICLLETAYPIFIWHKRTRALWLSGICIMHLMIGLTMGMYLFALVMIVLNLAAFGAEFIFAMFRRRGIENLTETVRSV